jgi:hypothetical protein
MKKIILLFALLLFGVSACEKEDSSETYEPIPNEGY